MGRKSRNAHVELKLNIEHKKIELEVRHPSRRWFVRHEYLSAIAAGLVLFDRGYRDVVDERRRSEDKRTLQTNNILNKELAESKITVHLERLVRVMEPNNVIGIQRHINRVLGSAPTDVELVAPTLLALRNLVRENDNFVPERLAIVRRYSEGPTTPPEMKDALKSILELKH
jgi:hypothetical protein